MTELKLRENKDKFQKLVVVAKKYDLDLTLIKDCLRGAPDPLLKEGELQLAGAEADLAS